MHLLIATDIWGRTAHVDNWAAELGGHASGVTIVDPYDGADPGFGHRDAAFDGYMAACGHDGYAERVSRALSVLRDPAFLVGFSAGAGAVWNACVSGHAGRAREAVCFYGSHIRTMAHLPPAIPVALVFPIFETGFDVADLVVRLSELPLTTCRIEPQGHGFMNPLSDEYDAEACAAWTSRLADRLTA